MKNLLYINGQWTGDNLEKVEVRNPATGEFVSKVPKGGQNEALHAVEAAANAFEQWSEKTAYDRAKIIKGYFDLILEHKKEIAELIIKEIGKHIVESIDS